MGLLQNIKNLVNTNIRLKTVLNKIKRQDHADIHDDIIDEIGLRGIVNLDNATDIANYPPTDTEKVLDLSTGDFYALGTSNISGSIQSAVDPTKYWNPVGGGSVDNSWHTLIQTDNAPIFDVSNGAKQYMELTENGGMTFSGVTDGFVGYLMVRNPSNLYTLFFTADFYTGQPTIIPNNSDYYLFRIDGINGGVAVTEVDNSDDVVWLSIDNINNALTGKINSQIATNQGQNAWLNRAIVGGSVDKGGALQVDGGAFIFPSSAIAYPVVNGGTRYDSVNHIYKGYVNGVEQSFAMIGSITDANTIYVNSNNPNATDTRTGLSKYSMDRPFMTITAAFAAATNIDSIYITGTYTNQHISISGTGSTFPKSITLWDANLISTTSTTTISINPSSGGVNWGVFLYNSSIQNSGGGIAAQFRTSNGSVRIMGIGNSSITSNNVALDHRRCRVDNLNISSTTSTGTVYALTGGSGNEVSYFVNCNITSTGRGTDKNAQFENCFISCTNRIITGPSTGSGLGYLIKNCTLISTNESIAQFAYGGSQPDQFIVKNCLIKSNTTPFQIGSGNVNLTGLNLNLYDNVIETAASYVATMPTTTSPSVIIASNNNSNKDIIDPSTSPAVTHILNNNFINTSIKTL